MLFIVIFTLLAGTMAGAWYITKRYPTELSPEGAAEQETLQEMLAEEPETKRKPGRPRKNPVA